MIKQEFIIQSKICAIHCQQLNFISPNFSVARTIKSGIVGKLEVVRFIGIGTYSATSTFTIINLRGKAIDKRIKPPRMFHELSERVLPVDGAVEDFAVEPESVTQNRAVILPHKIISCS